MNVCKVGDCGRRLKGHGMCSMHLQRFRKTGDPGEAVARKRRNGGWLAELLAESVRDTERCVILPGYASRPVVKYDGVQMNASRAVWIAVNGDPGDLLVLHTCGRGLQGCVNLRHLYLGTSADNGRDTAAAGTRRGISGPVGSDCHTARLTESDVREIRRRYQAHGRGQKGPDNQRILAAEFGITQASVSAILLRQSWAHVD